jgi:hypothetical protein
VKTFKAEYIPDWVMEKRVEEFQNLRQGSMTVAQYAARFNQLSKYCPQLVLTETTRTRQFTKGLWSALRRALVSLHSTSFTTVVNVATRTENEDHRRMAQRPIQPPKPAPRPPIQKRPGVSQWSDRNKQARFSAPGPSAPGPFATPPNACRNCGCPIHMARDCRLPPQPKRCYNCGDVGHLNYSCPKPKKLSQGHPKMPTSGNRGAAPGANRGSTPKAYWKHKC